MTINRRFVAQSTLALLLVGLAALVGIVGTTIWLNERSRVFFNDVVRAREARSSAAELRNAVVTAESSQRGFAVTGNEIYLAPYANAKAEAASRLESLKRAATDYHELNAAIDRLTKVLDEKFTEMDRTINQLRERRDAEALATIRSNRGKALMDEANIYLTGAIRVADDRLAEGVTEQRANAVLLRWISIFGGGVIVLVVGGAAVTVWRHARELAAARIAVEQLNFDLEDRVRRRTAQLAETNDEIQRFAYIVTHDLRAPLVNIMGFTSELESGVKALEPLVGAAKAGTPPPRSVIEEAETAATEDLPEAIGFIRSSTRKMDSLIGAILKISRDGRRTLRPERVEIADVVAASVAAIQHQLAEADGRVRLDLKAPPIHADRIALEQIFANLLDNAVKYRRKTTPLDVLVRSRRARGDTVEIEFADNGRGVAEQDRERVFELFRRSGAQDQPGEGIGLAHVRTLVRNMGGDIGMTSSLNKGATFTITLPRNAGLVEEST